MSWRNLSVASTTAYHLFIGPTAKGAQGRKPEFKLTHAQVRTKHPACQRALASPAEDHPAEAPVGDGEIDGADDQHRHHGRPDERDVGAAEQRGLGRFGARLPKLIEELTDALAALATPCCRSRSRSKSPSTLMPFGPNSTRSAHGISFPRASPTIHRSSRTTFRSIEPCFASTRTSSFSRSTGAGPRLPRDLGEAKARPSRN